MRSFTIKVFTPDGRSKDFSNAKDPSLTVTFDENNNPTVHYEDANGTKRESRFMNMPYEYILVTPKEVKKKAEPEVEYKKEDTTGI